MKSYLFLFFLAATALFNGCSKKTVGTNPTPPPAPNPAVVRTGSLGITGDSSNAVVTPQSGFLLMGGSTDVDEAITWFLQRSGGGDIVVLRASGATGYNNYMFGLQRVNSVETLLINSRDLANNDTVAHLVRQAEAVFIAGGDQWNYTRFWKDTKLSRALQYLVSEKKAPIGGTSAGMAILGEFFFDASNGTIRSEDALANPYDSRMSINNRLLISEILDNTITDTHYDNPDRRGRHTVMLARMVRDSGILAKGIGVEERTALALTLEGQMAVYGSGQVWWLEATGAKPEQCSPGLPLEWDANQRAVRYKTLRGSSTGSAAGNYATWHQIKAADSGFISVKGGALRFLK